MSIFLVILKNSKKIVFFLGLKIVFRILGHLTLLQLFRYFLWARSTASQCKMFWNFEKTYKTLEVMIFFKCLKNALPIIFIANIYSIYRYIRYDVPAEDIVPAFSSTTTVIQI